MSKTYKQKKSLKLKKLKKSKTIKLKGGAGQNPNPIKTINNLDRTLELLEETYELDKTLTVNNQNNNNEKKRKNIILTETYYKNKLKYMIELFRLYWKNVFDFKNRTDIKYDNLINTFTIKIVIGGDYNLILNIDDIINFIILKKKEDNNYNKIVKGEYEIDNTYFDIIFRNQTIYNKYRSDKDKKTDKEYITDVLILLIMQLFNEHVLFNYDILMFLKMFKDDLKHYMKHYATDDELKTYTVYQQLNKEYLNFIYLYSNLKKKVCNHIYSTLIDIDKNDKLTKIVKNDKKLEIINKHKDFLNNLLNMLEEKKLYFLDHNNNRINESKLNHATKLLLRQKVLNSSYSYVQEKKSDDVCITKIKQMLEFIKSDNGSGGQSLKQPLAAIPS